MPDTSTELRGQFTAIDARLAAPDAGMQRDALKADIISLYRQIDLQINELNALKEQVKALVDRWKTLPQASTASITPRFTDQRPVVVADHIGASTFVEKGWSLISLGDFDGAEKSLNKAAELSPNDPQTESLLGWAQMLQEKYDDALANFQRVLMREPANSLARINLGYICLKKHIFGEAIEHLSKAIRLDNDRKATLYAHFYLGLVYLEREMFDDAQTFFRKTIALGPNLIEAYYELGRSLWFDGKREQAMQTWREGAAANSFNPWGKRCTEMLRHIEQGGAPSRTG
ncbi:MAG: tetratricopeptide repeat protein [Gemmatimonadota bacterium]|nr:tetratricopeptide repeat protein [Gemmatimonadota bacterium]